MQYREFLDHIYKKYSGNVKLGLERMQGLLDDLGKPQQRLKGFHIAGTNGKGSVCAALEALCLQLDGSTGLNTSPHLISYTERFRVDGKDLEFEEILACFTEYEALFEKWDASFFEITTAIAILIFSRRAIDHTVMEVGLGGRLDATNLWTPDLTAITTIGLDHVKTLGGTEELIATEKAGIIKPFIPVVLGDIPSKPLEIIKARAHKLGAPIHHFGTDFKISNLSLGPDGATWDYEGSLGSFKEIKSNMNGLHQAHNLSIALTAFLLYLDKYRISVDESKIRTALEHVNWQGRMQKVRSHPTVIVDGAHNVQGVQALTKSLALIYPNTKIRFILSILADKNYTEMTRLICELASVVYIAQNQSDRAASVEDQLKVVKRFHSDYRTAGSVKEAYRMALTDAQEGEIIVGGGSLYTVGEILSTEVQNGADAP